MPRKKEGLYSLPRLRYLALVRPLVRRSTTEGLRFYPRRNPIARGLLALDRRVLSRLLPEERPELSPSLRQRLECYYRTDSEQLENYLERSVAHWFTGRQ